MACPISIQAAILETPDIHRNLEKRHRSVCGTTIVKLCRDGNHLPVPIELIAQFRLSQKYPGVYLVD